MTMVERSRKWAPVGALSGEGSADARRTSWRPRQDTRRLPASPSLPENRRRHESLWATETSGMGRVAQELAESGGYGAGGAEHFKQRAFHVLRAYVSKTPGGGEP